MWAGPREGREGIVKGGSQQEQGATALLGLNGSWVDRLPKGAGPGAQDPAGGKQRLRIIPDLTILLLCVCVLSI